ncbi:MAG: hypothetical protein D3910_01865, partial [Candidatus Electrothrix sp. ATG2]|nr:hypothetical protein [Candidatus Electrothrix sp. ATG2]
MCHRLFVFVVLLILIPSQASSWDDTRTHPALTKEAVKRATGFEGLLTYQLGFEDTDVRLSNGQDTRPITEWLTEGSHLEDVPVCRAANHFHNPWELWKDSMLTDPTWFTKAVCSVFYSQFGIPYSNISWATGIRKADGSLMPKDINGLDTPEEYEGRNWQVARNNYYSALIEPAPDDREKKFAETFLTLGYILHLLQDMAVPAHTRNDFSQGHNEVIGCPPGEWWCYFETVLLKIGWVGNPFEAYLRNNTELIGKLIADNNMPFTGEKKLTTFWDTDTLIEGTKPDNPTLISQNIGLAEYSNANFFSFGTIPYDDIGPEHQFDYPSKDSLVDFDYPELLNVHPNEYFAGDGKVDKVLHVEKNREGEDITNFLGIRYLARVHRDLTDPDFQVTSVDWKRDFLLDDQCYLDYATKLIPRAVGYSASLLDYFFRGKLDFTFNGSEITVFNSSEEIMQNGKFELYSDTEEGVRSPVLSEPVTVEFLPPGASQTFSVDGGIPGDAEQLILVYTGELGNEKPADSEDPRQVGAVIGRVLRLDSRIAYSFQADSVGNPSHIYTTSSDGSESYQLTGNTASASAAEPVAADFMEASAESEGLGTPEDPLYFSPAWSRDGDRMVFETMYCTDYNSDMSCNSVNVVRDLSVIDTHSESPFPESQTNTLTYNDAWLSYPSFSPDGTRVAALMQKSNEIAVWFWANLVVLNVEDGTSTIINDYDDPLYTMLAGSRPVWSPDGEQILYAVYQRYNDETHQMELEGDLILVNPDTKEMTELTNDAWFDTNPSWSPDGE